MPIDKQNTDRDVLIRVDADLKNLNTTVKEVRERQGTQEQSVAQLTLNLNTLTLNIGALVASMNEMKEAIGVLTQHDNRLNSLEQWKEHQNEKLNDVREDLTKDVTALKTQVEEDKKQWEPVVDNLKHWRWLIAGAVAVVGVTGWPFIVTVLKFVAGL